MLYHTYLVFLAYGIMVSLVLKDQYTVLTLKHLCLKDYD